MKTAQNEPTIRVSRECLGGHLWLEDAPESVEHATSRHFSSYRKGHSDSDIPQYRD